jgi:hypothetical protein
VGSRFSLHHDYALETLHLGEVEVVYLAKQGRAIARPLGKMDMLKVGKGDRVSGRTAGSAAPVESVAVAPKTIPTRSMPARSTTAEPTPSKTILRRATQAEAPRPAALRAATLAPAEPAKVRTTVESSQSPVVKRAPQIAVALPPVPSLAEVEVSDSRESRDDASAQTKPAASVRLVQPRPVKRASAAKPTLSTPKPESEKLQRSKATEITFVAPSTIGKPAADAAPASWVTVED